MNRNLLKNRKKLSKSFKATVVYDLKPVIEYYGRHIIVKSDGTACGTDIWIDGVKAENIREWNIDIKAGDIVVMKSTMIDLV